MCNIIYITHILHIHIILNCGGLWTEHKVLTEGHSGRWSFLPFLKHVENSAPGPVGGVGTPFQDRDHGGSNPVWRSPQDLRLTPVKYVVIRTAQRRWMVKEVMDVQRMRQDQTVAGAPSINSPANCRGNTRTSGLDCLTHRRAVPPSSEAVVINKKSEMGFLHLGWEPEGGQQREVPTPHSYRVSVCIKCQRVEGSAVPHNLLQKGNVCLCHSVRLLLPRCGHWALETWLVQLRL